MKNVKKRFGPWAVVTGASSGIGESFARHLASLGLNLVLVARREDRLRKLADELHLRTRIEVRTVTADLSRDDFMPLIERATEDLQVGLLVNNAGVATPGNFLDNDLDAELALLHVNARATLMLAHHFGQSMRTLGRGGMIFVASTLSYSAVPGWSNYAASKAYDLAFAEGIARELKSAGVSVMAVCPGPTRTEIWPSGARLSLAMKPAEVVEIALKKLGRRSTIVTGRLNSLIAFSTRLLPRSWNARIFGRVAKGILNGGRSPVATHPVSLTNATVHSLQSSL